MVLLSSCNVYDASLLPISGIGGATAIGAGGAASTGTGGSSGAAGSGGADGSAGAAGPTGGGGGLAAGDASPANDADARVVDAPPLSPDGPRLEAAFDVPPTGEVGPPPIVDAAVEVAPDVRDASPDARDANPDAPPCAGSALNFNGATYASVTRPVQDDFTIEAWIQTTASLAGTNYWQGLGLLYADLSGQANDFATAILSDKLAFGLGNPDITLLSTSNVTTGQWVHVAVTRRESTGEMQVIVGGVLEASVISSNRAPLAAPPIITIGANTVDGHFFVGLMDEVRVWTVVRTPAEITATMHQRLNGNETGLRAYWRFDEGGGATAVDSSPNNLNATFVGAPAWVPSNSICSP
jgi:hypothetical protein